MHPARVRIDPASWAAGYRAAFAGPGPAPIPAGLDPLSGSSGRIEGEADRLAGRPSQVDPEVDPGPVPGM